jgi:hypothetical protein
VRENHNLLERFCCVSVDGATHSQQYGVRGG